MDFEKVEEYRNKAGGKREQEFETIGYKKGLANYTAFISPSGRGLNMANDVYFTTEKLIIADDYAKKGREEESYALLGNAYENFKDFGASQVKGKEATNVYNSIGKRALKYAKNVAGKNLELAKNFLQLAKECEAAYGKAQKSK